MIIWSGGRPKRAIEIIPEIIIDFKPVPNFDEIIYIENRLIKEKACIITDINKDNLEEKDIEILEV